ncbi:MAG: energy transducer TonB [Acidobacteriota bacterium]
MTDNELSDLLQEWKRTPAPATLDARVLDSRRLPAPAGWWNRIPALPVAATGVAGGALVVWALITLLPSTPPAAPVAEPAVVQQAAAPKVEPVEELPAPAPKPRPKKMPVTVPGPAKIISTPPLLVSGPPPAYPADAPPLRSVVIIHLRIRIGADGRVIEAEALDATDPVLGALAVDAVKEWMYRPRYENGLAVEANSETSVIFAPKEIPRSSKGVAK